MKSTSINSIRKLGVDQIFSGNALLDEAYVNSVRKNVLAAERPEFYEGFFSVTADGVGHGGNIGNDYPGLDWGQTMEALLWLGQSKKVLAAWNHIKSFMREDGLLPFAIFPSCAGKTLPTLNDNKLHIDSNGAVYDHWCPANPFRALANVTFLQVADAICRHVQDAQWLAAQVPALRKCADWLISLVNDRGLVKGCGFYMERPARVEFDGIDQCYTANALQRTSLLFDSLGLDDYAKKCRQISKKITLAFRRYFWVGDRFAQYIHPKNGKITHGYSDVDWAAIATGLASQEQSQILWPALKNNQDFYYDEMPTGVSTRPDAFEPWEYENLDLHDLAAMGRIWYLEAWARYNMNDAGGLLDSLMKVAKFGAGNGWQWLERYYSKLTGDVGAGKIDTYIEYPANLIRIVNQFVLGINKELDGSVEINPCATGEMWEHGFGKVIPIRGSSISILLKDGTLETVNDEGNDIQVELLS